MKKILFPIAYSKFSENTWKYVLRLAQYFEAAVTVMHVYEDNNLITGGDGVMEEFYDNSKNAGRQEQYLKEVERIQKFVGNKPKQYHTVKVETLIKIGGISNSILAEEQSGGYDLVVLGTTTTKAFPERILGSVSRNVMNQSETPIFLVPPKAQFYGINKIIYATKFSSGDIETIEKLLEWQKIFKSELHLLHVYKNEVEKQEATQKMNKLVHHFKDAGENDKLSHQLEKGSITDGIRKYAGMNDGDMIALLTHKRGMLSQIFQPSVVNAMTSRVLAPILIFKEKA